MGFLGFESKSEKSKRLKQLDKENEDRKLKCKAEGKPFFGIRYLDDYRDV